MNKFRVICNGQRRYFNSLDEAKAMTERYFKRTGIVLGIEAVKARKRKTPA